MKLRIPVSTKVLQGIGVIAKPHSAETKTGVSEKPEVSIGTPQIVDFTSIAKALAEIATQAWKAREKMIDPASKEIRDDMRRIGRHVDAVLACVQSLGLEVKDHTGELFDYGMPQKIIAAEHREGVSQDVVIETIKPTIYWKKEIIQIGEVVIATPAEKGA